MSDLGRSFAKSKLPPLPPESPTKPDASAAPYSGDDSSSASSVSSVGTVRPTSSHQEAPQANSLWTQSFEQELHLDHNFDDGIKAQYHVYLTAPSSPKSVLFVCHHGAGASALSFSLLAQRLKRQVPEAGILSYDCRGHGSTIKSSVGEEVIDYSLPALSNDLSTVLQLVKTKLSWPQLPPLVLIGHSLGGAVVVTVAKDEKLGNQLLGYAVLDVVEGSALDALKHMQTLLASRPTSFPSIEAAVDWHVRSRTLRDPASARLSVPSLLVPLAGGDGYGWRTDLAETSPWWEGWFEGMSKKFLQAKGGKLLILAGTDRLDRELMIGQMQGKFQLSVLPSAGHFVHEDCADEVAQTLIEFWKRNDRSALVLPPKVSELLAMGKKV